MGSIRVRHLGKAYKRYPNHWSRLAEWIMPNGKKRHELKWVLQDINFHIKSGEAVAIIGVNGAGKSTLLKLITGTTQATTGNVEVSGRVAALLELGMGFHPDFTGRQNVLMAGQLIGMHVEEIAALMPQIEAFAEIGDYIDQPVRVYSSGMQVRLAFSVATAIRPDILIVDEALAVGDVFFQQKCYERIRSYCEGGTTLLFVSHAMGTVYSLCDRAILLHEGSIALDDSPKAVIDLYNAHVLHQHDGSHGNKRIVGNPVSASSPSRASHNEDTAMPAKDAPPSTGLPSDAAIGSFESPGTVIEAIELLVRDCPVNTVVSDSEATIRVQVLFKKDYEDPHVGFQIRNARGEPVFMTNTFCMYRTIGPVIGGERVSAEFSLKMGLIQGDYTITAGVAEGGAGEGEFRQTLARLNDARAFTIVKNLEAILWAGVCNLNPTCKLFRIPFEDRQDRRMTIADKESLDR